MSLQFHHVPSCHAVSGCAAFPTRLVRLLGATSPPTTPLPLYFFSVAFQGAVCEHQPSCTRFCTPGYQDPIASGGDQEKRHSSGCGCSRRHFSAIALAERKLFVVSRVTGTASTSTLQPLTESSNLARTVKSELLSSYKKVSKSHAAGVDRCTGGLTNCRRFLWSGFKPLSHSP